MSKKSHAVKDIQFNDGDFSSMRRVALMCANHNIKSYKYPKNSTMLDFKYNHGRYTNVRLNKETVTKLLSLVHDGEFNKLVSTNWRFAVPFLDRMFLSFQVERNGSIESVAYAIKSVDNGFEVQNLYLISGYAGGKVSSVVSYGRVDLDKNEGCQFNFIDDLDRNENFKDYIAVISLLLVIFFLLVHSKPSYLKDIPSSLRMTSNKLIPYAAHKTIDLTLFEPKEVIRMLTVKTSVDHASMRAHNVRGHWVHYGLDPHCDHDSHWERVELDEDDPRRRVREKDGSEIIRYRCMACGGRRTFRENFIRGDASKGWVNHSYSA